MTSFQDDTTFLAAALELLSVCVQDAKLWDTKSTKQKQSHILEAAWTYLYEFVEFVQHFFYKKMASTQKKLESLNATREDFRNQSAKTRPFWSISRERSRSHQSIDRWVAARVVKKKTKTIFRDADRADTKPLRATRCGPRFPLPKIPRSPKACSTTGANSRVAGELDPSRTMRFPLQTKGYFSILQSLSVAH